MGGVISINGIENMGAVNTNGTANMWVVFTHDIGSGRVDMLTGPVAAARAVVATGAWVKSKHDMYLIRGSVGA